MPIAKSSAASPPTASDRPVGADTRRAIVRRQGLEGASTRIAAAANANIGSIAYHFGGRKGCAPPVRLHRRHHQAMPGRRSRPRTRLQARRGNHPAQRCAGRMVGFVVAQPEAGESCNSCCGVGASDLGARYHLQRRVCSNPHLCQIWAGERQDAERPHQITVFTMIGRSSISASAARR